MTRSQPLGTWKKELIYFYWHITLSQEGRGKWSGEVISSSYLTGQNKCAQSTEIIENKETK